ncbi:MAG: exodeoxyribonuclease VII large subunit [Syntrophobacterales bacterium CG_4_8_14_3_um_filter_58_8]|nr:MAG: exodeoxyribonuclease VII large subunit [Syntrophaceae bacterium CG2_30_58_14]PIV00432.1 MAG: exodeoxyribonuclease VII large subunit [Syntrophobacterales bacterium CG03_land_8_20_14_0_80_58_14]PJC71718.1 MAG: exodeoxyribonuclease VII large subunit [Syntrophobacterales bacterium CG_4_8_14_3_um_filter_58_8]
MDSGNLKEILTVSALNDRIKAILEGLAAVWVEGEVSNLRRPASGHVYFTLKDMKSQIRAVIFRSPFGGGWNRPAAFAIEEGMSLVCRARVTVYPPRGEYQLIIDAVEPRGLGALQKAFEQLKARLEAEGLFDPARKKPLPFLPARIGVVTSPTGAVIRDILTVTRRRFPSVDIRIAPVRVQGTEAPAEIIRALGDLQIAGGIDVIILARGGGSLEDFAPFNDEGVARAIARSRIPVISAVGHETDFTIADFTADLRAATPSAAAELAVPLRAELLETVGSLRLRLIRRLRQERGRRRERIAELQGRLRDPKRRLADVRIALDDHLERMRLSVARLREAHRQAWAHLSIRLEHRNPRSRIAEGRTGMEGLGRMLRAAWEKQAALKKNRARAAMALLSSLSPLAVLGRGYSITRRRPDGLILRRAGETAPGQEIDIRLAAGNLNAIIIETFKEPSDVQREV